MLGRMTSRRSVCLTSILLLVASGAVAQFTAGIQGEVTDPTGAGVPKASVTLTNMATQVSAVATSDSSGNYRFVSLAPGSYKVTAQAPGFAKSEANISLLNEQNLNV